MATRIKRLPEELVRQIAAGEVVERPASVVKELLENALDAGARRVEIHVEGGGRKRILVRDNGCGMNRADAALAFERHATSKISSAEDLEKIRSFGFRGEALPSIASVARVRLLTAVEGEREGTEVTIEGSAQPSVRPAPPRRGTEIEVSDLFFNTPARQKFLRAPQTETRRIADIVARHALAHEGVAFLLRSEKKALLDCPPAASPSERAAQVLGRDMFEGFVPVEGREAMYAVSGFVTRPQQPLPSRDHIYFFVNRRPVQDRVLVGALMRVVGKLPSGTYPGAVLFLEMPSEAVDVNVHPAKTEVRFRDGSAVFKLLEHALARALGTRGVFMPPRRTAFTTPTSNHPPSAINYQPASFSVRNGREAYAVAASPEAEDFVEALAASEPRLVESVGEPLAQYAGTYILAEEGDSLLVVDQHAAHERVLYERLLDACEAGSVPRQAMLFPLVVELPPNEAIPDAAFLGGTLARLGFEAEAFGSRSLRLTAVPAEASHADAGKLFREVLALLADPDSGGGTFDKAVATMACRSAVVKNTTLTREAMKEILRGLSRTQNPSVCPHGRPTTMRYPLADLERDFRRR